MTDEVGDRMSGVGPGGAWPPMGGDLGGGASDAADPGGDVSGAGDPGAQGRERHEPGAEAGMTTVEYTVGTIAAASFAILLLNIIRSRQVLEWIVDILHAALSVPSRL